MKTPALAFAIFLPMVIGQDVQSTGSIEGVLIDAGSRSPVPNAQVRLLQCQPGGPATMLNLSARTDSQGRFLFGKLPACGFVLAATADGYLDAFYGQSRPGISPGRPLSILAGQQLRGLEFRIARGGAVSGEVRGSAGEPVSSARVEVIRVAVGADLKAIAIAGQATTDDRGFYRVFGLSPGRYVVRAIRPLVTKRVGTPKQTSLPTCEAASNAAGGAAYYPSQPTLGTASSIVLDLSQDLSGLQIRIPADDRILLTGVVSGPGDQIPRGLLAILVDHGVCVATAGVASDGRFNLGYVPRGSYRLEVRAMSLTPAPAQPAQSGEPVLWGATDVHVASTSVEVRVALEPGVRVAGVVETDDGRWRPELGYPGRPLTVTLESPVGGLGVPQFSLRTTVDETGLFQFPGVPLGKYFVRVPPGRPYGGLQGAVTSGKDALDFGLDVSTPLSDLTLTVSNRTSRVAGQMTARPTAMCFAVAFPTDRQYWIAGSRRVLAVLPDSLGQFEFRSLPSGQYAFASYSGKEPESWSDPAFLGALRVSSTVRLAAGERQSISLQCN